MLKSFANRLAAVLLTVILAVGVCNTDTSAATPKKENNYDYTDAISFFTQLGVVNEDEINDAPMTRGGFVHLLMKALNNPYDYVSSSHHFNDVTAEQPWFESVGRAFNQGIISGYSENEFRPYETLSSAHATQVLKNVMNVKENTDDVSPFEVITRISDFNDIFDDVDTSKDYFTIGDSLMMFYNMLTVPRNILDINREISSKDDLLRECWDAYVISGVLESTDMCSLLSGDPCSDDRVVISGKTFRTDGSRYEKFLGYTVDAYIRTSDKDDREYVLCLNIVSGNNKTLELDSTMISEGCFDGEKLTYTPSDSEKERNVRVSKTVNVMYNGMFRGAEFSKSDFDVKLGTVRLIDNNDNGVYDIAIIEEYSTIVASGTATSGEQMISDYYNPDDYLKFNDDKFKNTVELYFDGVPGEVSKIKTQDLINYYVSVNDEKRYVKAYVVRDTVAGSLNEDGEDFFTVNGKKLRKAYQFKTKVTRGDTPKVGSYGIFRLNFLGEAEVFEGLTTTDLFYGIALGVVNKSFDDFQIVIYTSGMEQISFDTVKNLRIDGKTYKTADAVRAKLAETKYEEYNDNADIYCQLIKYKISDGKISKIYTTAGDSAESPKIGAPFAKREFLTVGNVYGDRVREFRVDQETKYFIVPPLKNGKMPFDELCVTDIDGIGNTASSRCQAYDLDDYGLAKIVVFLHTYDSENYETSPVLYLVEQNNEKLSKNGDEVRELVLFSKGSMYNYETYSEDVGKDLVPGDLIFLVKDYENRIRYIDKKYSLQYPRLTQGLINGQDRYRSNSRLGAQYMTAVSDGWAWLTYDEMKSKDPSVEAYKGIWNLGSVNITLFDEKMHKAEVVSSADLPLYISQDMGNDYLVMTFENYGQMQDCIIYKLEDR